MKLLCMIAVFVHPWVASDAQKQDWGNLKRYAEANKELVRKGKTEGPGGLWATHHAEGWVANDAAFLKTTNGHGIGGPDFRFARCHQLSGGMVVSSGGHQWQCRLSLY